MKKHIDPFFILLLLSITASFGWRFLAIPWDFGGCFLQIMVAFVSLLCATDFLQNIPLAKNISKDFSTLSLLKILFILLVSSVLFGTISFAPQVLFPFIPLGFLCIFAIMIALGKVEKNVLIAFLKTPIIALVGSLILLLLCLWGYSAMTYVYRISMLRHLVPTKVQSLRFTRGRGEEDIQVTDMDAIREIGTALKFTSPYSPNHEGINQRWTVQVLFTSGERLEFQLGKGNKAHPQTAWIEFGVHVYQNPQLLNVLERRGIFLWTDTQEEISIGTMK